MSDISNNIDLDDIEKNRDITHVASAQDVGAYLYHYSTYGNVDALTVNEGAAKLAQAMIDSVVKDEVDECQFEDGFVGCNIGGMPNDNFPYLGFEDKTKNLAFFEANKKEIIAVINQQVYQFYPYKPGDYFQSMIFGGFIDSDELIATYESMGDDTALTGMRKQMALLLIDKVIYACLESCAVIQESVDFMTHRNS